MSVCVSVSGVVGKKPERRNYISLQFVFTPTRPHCVQPRGPCPQAMASLPGVYLCMGQGIAKLSCEPPFTYLSKCIPAGERFHITRVTHTRSTHTAHMEHTRSTHGAHTGHTRGTHGAHCKKLYRTRCYQRLIKRFKFFIAQVYSNLQCASCVPRVCPVCAACVPRVCCVCASCVLK